MFTSDGPVANLSVEPTHTADVDVLDADLYPPKAVWTAVVQVLSYEVADSRRFSQVRRR